VLLVVASFCDPEKFYTLLDCVLQYDGSCTIFLRQQGDGMVSSPSYPRIATGDSHDIGDLRNPHDLPDQLC
jgi:hypothetical protein